MIFTTSRLTDAISDDPQFYDNFVQSLADDAPALGALGLEWQAFMSLRGENIKDRTQTDASIGAIPIYRVDGRLFVSDYASLFVGGVRSDLSVNEFGSGIERSFDVNATLFMRGPARWWRAVQD